MVASNRLWISLARISWAIFQKERHILKDLSVSKIFGSHKLGGFSESLYSFPSNDIMSKGTCSVDDASSVVDAPETSELASSSGHSLETKNKSLVRRDKQHQDKARAWSFNGYADSSEVTVSNGEMAGATKSSEPQQTCQGQGKANTTTQCVTSTSTSEVTKSFHSSKLKSHLERSYQ